jgi:GTPase SAR1 family protein
MYSLASGVYSYYLSPKSISVLFVGCDGAGKTALLERCKTSKFTKRRFAPAAVAGTCRDGVKGRRDRSTNPVNGDGSGISYSRGNSSTSESRFLRVNAPQQHLNMEKIRPTGMLTVLSVFGLCHRGYNLVLSPRQ